MATIWDSAGLHGRADGEGSSMGLGEWGKRNTSLAPFGGQTSQVSVVGLEYFTERFPWSQAL